MSGLDLIITITDRSKCELFINWFRGRDIPLVLTALGQGTATTEILAQTDLLLNACSSASFSSSPSIMQEPPKGSILTE